MRHTSPATKATDATGRSGTRGPCIGSPCYNSDACTGQMRHICFAPTSLDETAARCLAKHNKVKAVCLKNSAGLAVRGDFGIIFAELDGGSSLFFKFAEPLRHVNVLHLCYHRIASGNNYVNHKTTARKSCHRAIVQAIQHTKRNIRFCDGAKWEVQVPSLLHFYTEELLPPLAVFVLEDPRLQTASVVHTTGQRLLRRSL